MPLVMIYSKLNASNASSSDNVVAAFEIADPDWNMWDVFFQAANHDSTMLNMAMCGDDYTTVATMTDIDNSDRQIVDITEELLLCCQAFNEIIGNLVHNITVMYPHFNKSVINWQYYILWDSQHQLAFDLTPPNNQHCYVFEITSQDIVNATDVELFQSIAQLLGRFEVDPQLSDCFENESITQRLERYL